MDTGGIMDINMGIDTDTDSGHGYKHGFEDMDTGMDILWAPKELPPNPEKYTGTLSGKPDRNSN